MEICSHLLGIEISFYNHRGYTKWRNWFNYNSRIYALSICLQQVNDMNYDYIGQLKWGLGFLISFLFVNVSVTIDHFQYCKYIYFSFFFSLRIFVTRVFVSVCIPLFHQYRMLDGLELIRCVVFVVLYKLYRVFFWNVFCLNTSYLVSYLAFVIFSPFSFLYILILSLYYIFFIMYLYFSFQPSSFSFISLFMLYSYFIFFSLFFFTFSV